jgi:hypothetical protein
MVAINVVSGLAVVVASTPDKSSLQPDNKLAANNNKSQPNTRLDCLKSVVFILI